MIYLEMIKQNAASDFHLQTTTQTNIRNYIIRLEIK